MIFGLYTQIYSRTNALTHIFSYVYAKLILEKWVRPNIHSNTPQAATELPYWYIM